MRHAIGITAVMAGQHAKTLVICQCHITVIAVRHPAARLTFNHVRETTAVLEEYNLPVICQCLAHGGDELWREQALHYLSATQVFHVDNLYLRQLHALISGLQFHKSIFSLLSIVIALHRRCCRPEQCLRPIYLRKHYRC